MVKNLSTDIAESDLVSQCLKNNRKAQKQMYEWLAPRMFALCIRYVGDREFAKDVLHDGFITLFSKLSTYKGEGSLEGWARRIFVTTALMQLRKHDILKRAEDVEQVGQDMTYDSGVIDKIDSQTLLKLVSQMPSGFRTVFNMYAIEGYSHQEIAQELNITEGGSRSQLSRAKVWLKEKLKNFD